MSNAESGISHEKQEKNARLEQELQSYLTYFYGGMTLNPEASLIHPGIDNIKTEIAKSALLQGREVINRNNAIADLLRQPEYQKLVDRQHKMKGSCAIGVVGCIDGRIPWAHLTGWTAGIWEQMAGRINTYRSDLNNRLRLESQTLKQTIISKPVENNELLEIFTAHTSFHDKNHGCGAMKKWQGDNELAGQPFESDDLIQENLNLFTDGIDAVTRLYNNAAAAADKRTLAKVAIRGVYDTDSMGYMFGYGEEKPFFTTEVAQRMAPSLKGKLVGKFQDGRYGRPGILRHNFSKPEKFFEKEEMVTNITEFLLTDDDFQQEIEDALERLDELQDLTPKQQQAFKFFNARIISMQYVTGLFEKTPHPNHPFSHHNETYQAITRDDGLTVTVGQFDPEVQVFGATIPNSEIAVDHILTQSTLMDANGNSNRDKVKKPYLLFISSGLPEGAQSKESYKQARANVGRTFRQIVENDPSIREKIKNGELTPIPVIIKNKSHEIVEIPNLAL